MTHSTSQPGSGAATVTALFFVETRNRAEVEEMKALAADIAQHGDVRPVSEGVITAYAVRLPVAGAPLLSSLETTLKRDFLFGHLEMPFQETIHRVVEDLALETGSDLMPVASCELCQTPEPFPTPVQVMGEDGRMRRSRATYCATCAANMAAGRAEEAPAPEPAPKTARKTRASA